MSFTRWISLFFLMVSSAEALMVNDLSYVGNFTPGETREVKITLTNDHDTPELVELKQYDYQTNKEGETHFPDPGTEPRSNAKWIRLSEERIRLAPKEKKDLFVTVKVPQDNNLSGSYFSALLIEPTDFIQSLEDVKSGIQLNVKVRFAFHIVTNVGEGQAKLKILDKQLVTMADKPLLAVDVSNIGTYFLNPKLTLKLYSAEGKLVKTLESSPERLYPGSSQRFFLNGEGLAGNQYKAFLVLDNGDKHLFGDTFDLSF